MPVPSLIEFAKSLDDHDIFIVEKGALVELATHRNEHKPALLHLSVEDQIAIDPRLPTAVAAGLRETARMIGEPSTDRVLSTYLQNTILYWTESQRLRLLSGEEMAYRTIALDEVDLKTTPYTIWVGATVYAVTSEIQANGSVVDVAQRSSYKEVRVCPMWLEEQFPGWQKRFEVAEVLGLKSNERSDYVLLQNNPGVALSIIGVTLGNAEFTE